MLLNDSDIKALLTIRRDDSDLTPAARATLLKIKEKREHPSGVTLRNMVEMLDNVTACLKTVMLHRPLIHMPEADYQQRNKLATEARQLVDKILRPQGYQAE